jgi:hypothetical protein
MHFFLGGGEQPLIQRSMERTVEDPVREQLSPLSRDLRVNIPIHIS